MRQQSRIRATPPPTCEPGVSTSKVRCEGATHSCGHGDDWEVVDLGLVDAGILIGA
jgi:hypothetical protein